jgi:hypothetical protein
VALIAGHIKVAARERKVRFIVIEGCIRPGGYGVTGGAVGAETASVRIVSKMACLASGRGIFKINKLPRIGMAFRADQTRMPAGQRELSRVCETFSEAVQSVMTIKACISIFDGMREAEDRLEFAVTGLARVNHERGNIPAVAILAREGQIRRSQLVTFQ